MIGRIEGRLLEKSPESVLIDVRGVGYELQVPLSTFLELPDTGKTVSFQVHTHVREDRFQLFGFLTAEERACFRLLLGVSGVGPRLALALLSGLPVDRLTGAIAAGDAATLRSIPGVGQRTAERISVELRGRTAKLAEARGPAVSARSEDEEATLSALLNLGYPPGRAEKAVCTAAEGLSERPSLEVLIREALRVAAG